MIGFLFCFEEKPECRCSRTELMIGLLIAVAFIDIFYSYIAAKNTLNLKIRFGHTRPVPAKK